MRLLIIVILCIATAGCGSISSRNEREIALMRAEILDLGDQYGDLKSRHRRALADLSACKGEPVSDYFPDTGAYYQETGEPYYPEGQIVGSGFVHSGTPDCCADCSRTYSGYGGEIIESGSSSLPSETPINLDPRSIQNSEPMINPIATPFEETLPGAGRPEPSAGDGNTTRIETRGQNEPLAHKGNSQSRWTQRAKSMINERIPAAEPAFRPNDSQWTQRSSERLPLEQNLADLSVAEGNAVTDDGTMPWRNASTTNSGPISNAPIDGRFLDEDFATKSNDNALVEQIFIDPENSSASDYDNDGGDDGIRLLIQPLDSQGQVVTRGAGMVISVIDANEVGQAQRIGLWKFESYQVESFVSNERGRRGFLLDLPWQRRSPKNRNLIVFVRYISESGQKLETSLDVQINPPRETGEFKMLDPMAEQQSRPNAASANNSANLPKWRPVR